MPVITRDTCPSCASVLRGRYCSVCGEDGCVRDYSVGRYLADALTTWTDLDGRPLRTFRAFVMSPGLLTAEFLAGRRVGYVGPIRVFLLCNVLLFLLTSWSAYATSLDTYAAGGIPGVFGSARHLVVSHLGVASGDLDQVVADARVWRRGGAEEALLCDVARRYEQLRERFDARVDVLSRTLVIGLVPLWALVFAMVHARLRRRFVEHLVLATHLVSAVMLLGLAIEWLIRIAFRLGLPSMPNQHVEGVFLTVFTVSCTAYVYVANRRVFGSRPPWSLVAALVSVIGYFVAHQVYRIALFFVSWFTLGDLVR